VTLKLLRTIRLDPSDTFAFPQAAEPGEWAVPGSFSFWDDNPAGLAGKRRVAFRSGWLGLTSFGWSTLAVVVRATSDEREQAVAALAAHLVAAHGAPDMAAARAAADDELSFAAACADHPEQTLVVIHRTLDPDGAVREQFRTVTPGLPFDPTRPSPAFTFVEETDGEVPDERIDLASLAGQEGR
jgi:hypothetical protein